MKETNIEVPHLIEKNGILVVEGIKYVALDYTPDACELYCAFKNQSCKGICCTPGTRSDKRSVYYEQR